MSKSMKFDSVAPNLDLSFWYQMIIPALNAATIAVSV